MPTDINIFCILVVKRKLKYIGILFNNVYKGRSISEIMYNWVTVKQDHRICTKRNVSLFFLYNI